VRAVKLDSHGTVKKDVDGKVEILLKCLFAKFSFRQS
jgi:acylphosphatase